MVLEGRVSARTTLSTSTSAPGVFLDQALEEERVHQERQRAAGQAELQAVGLQRVHGDGMKW